MNGVPFDNEGSHVGMTFQQVDSIASRNESRHFRCLPVVGAYRECWLRSPNTDEFFIVVLDKTNHVIVYRQRADRAYIRTHRSWRTSSLDEGERFRKQWQERGKLLSARSGTAVIDKWISPDRKYDAAIVIDQLGPDTAYLSELTMTDRAGAREYERLRSVLLPDSINIARASADTSEAFTGMKNELKRVADAQKIFAQARGRYARSLRELHFVPSWPLDVRIADAGTDGWWGDVSTRTSPGIVCFVWDGASPKPISAGMRAGTDPGYPYCRSNGS